MSLLILDPLVIALIVAGIGGAISAFIGWLDSDEVFDARKFSSGIIRGAIAGALLALAIDVEITVRTLILLFFTALGLDIVVNGVTKSIKKESKRRTK